METDPEKSKEKKQVVALLSPEKNLKKKLRHGAINNKQPTPSTTYAVRTLSSAVRYHSHSTQTGAVSHPPIPRAAYSDPIHFSYPFAANPLFLLLPSFIIICNNYKLFLSSFHFLVLFPCCRLIH